MSTKTVRREIDVRRQHRMSLAETWSLCMSGIKHRLFRSLLTLAVVVLAVAFFMFLLSESMFQRAVGRGVTAEVADARASQVLLTRLLSPATDLVSVRRLASADGAALDEAAAVSGMPGDEIRALAGNAKLEVTYTDFFERMPTGKRLVLVGKNTGRAAFRTVLSEGGKFFEQLAVMVDVRVPGKAEGLRAFVESFPEYEKKISAFTAAWNEAVNKAGLFTVSAMSGNDGFSSNGIVTDADRAARIAGADRWIPSAPEEKTEAWRNALVKLGFSFSPEQLAAMRAQFSEANEYADVFDRLTDPALRAEWSRAFAETKPSTADEKIARLLDPRAVELLSGSFDVPALERVAARHARQTRLAALERRLSAVLVSETSALGLTGRQLFLLAVSFLVCMVGIANAMLMSITERYREIATMKCLGATDSYILSQFMMEAALQGFFGGVAGVVTGFLISTARCSILYGEHLWRYFPSGDISLCALVSLAAGVLLAALASTQPSWSASRMAPMEAMRVE